MSFLVRFLCITTTNMYRGVWRSVVSAAHRVDYCTILCWWWLEFWMLHLGFSSGQNNNNLKKEKMWQFDFAVSLYLPLDMCILPRYVQMYCALRVFTYSSCNKLCPNLCS